MLRKALPTSAAYTYLCCAACCFRKLQRTAAVCHEQLSYYCAAEQGTPGSTSAAMLLTAGMHCTSLLCRLPLLCITLWLLFLVQAAECPNYDAAQDTPGSTAASAHCCRPALRNAALPLAVLLGNCYTAAAASHDSSMLT
jgi:hypothetical protein